MSRDSGNDTSHDEAPTKTEALDMPDVPDPLTAAVARGDDPLGMFAADTGQPRSSAPSVAEPVRPTIASPLAAAPVGQQQRAPFDEAQQEPRPPVRPGQRSSLEEAQQETVQPLPSRQQDLPAHEVLRTPLASPSARIDATLSVEASSPRQGLGTGRSESRPWVRQEIRLGEELRRPGARPPQSDNRVIPPAAIPTWRRRLLALIVATLVLGAIGFGVWRLTRSIGNQPVAPPPEQAGRLTVESQPTGAQVEIDGVVQGSTPLSLRVKAGHHLLSVGGRGGRQIDVVVAAGGDVSHHIELPEVRTQLHVATVPSTAAVRVDGQARGTAPLDLNDLSPGTHTITVERNGVTVRRDVDVRAGTDNSVVISLGGGGPTTGWLTVASPFDVDVYEGSRLVGRSRDGQMLLVSGWHDLTLANADLGYKEASRVSVTVGTTATIRVQPRSGQLSVNAIPWAEVFLDGNRIGETPIANYATTIGQHELLLRHPQLGEQRRTIVITLAAPTRIGVTFSK